MEEMFAIIVGNVVLTAGIIAIVLIALGVLGALVRIGIVIAGLRANTSAILPIFLDRKEAARPEPGSVLDRGAKEA